MPSDTSSHFFNRVHAAQGFAILGTLFGFFALISLIPDAVGCSRPPLAHVAWGVAAILCCVAASATLRRIGPGVASALTSAMLATLYLSAGFIIAAQQGSIDKHHAYFAALILGSAAILIAVLLRKNRRTWGAV